jgi:dihydrofolate synthase/folylpolyglutamate synthase
MRVDGAMIPQQSVMDFITRYRSMAIDCSPSFFELTMTMAFDWFASEGVDVAVIETGLGGRLDSTNIITPDLCVITNISLDHVAFLGSTLPAIAAEKAGIIKSGIPVVIGEAEGDVRDVFQKRADTVGAPIVYADDRAPIGAWRHSEQGLVYEQTPFGTVEGELAGACQVRNAATIMTAIEQLIDQGYHISADDVRSGFANVCELTGLAGRWMRISDNPLVICDTGHNVGGWEYISKQLAEYCGRKRMIIGFVNDKDVSHILEMMPRDAYYYFTQASVTRALSASDVAAQGYSYGLEGEVVTTVADAYKKALGDCAEGEMIFVGGSTFIVADLLASLSNR